MADWIGTRPGVFQGKRVLELGAGLGLPSFAASRWAKSVVASDLSPDAVEWMKFNADRLKVGNMRVEQLNWASDTLPAADILLLSDVGYNAGDFDDLKRLISTAVSEGAVIVLAVPSRGISPSFIDLVSGFSRERQICHHNGTDVLLMILGENSIRIE
jgi:predicted nicotinamide N-methyase